MFSYPKGGVDWMYLDVSGYNSVYTYKISGPGEFEAIQRFKVDGAIEGLVPTGVIAVSCEHRR